NAVACPPGMPPQHERMSHTEANDRPCSRRILLPGRQKPARKKARIRQDLGRQTIAEMSGPVFERTAVAHRHMNDAAGPDPAEQVCCLVRPMAADTHREDGKRLAGIADAVKHGPDLEREIEIVV